MSRLLNFLIVLLLAVDSFFICYAIGLNSRQALVIDPNMQPATFKATVGQDQTGATQPAR